MDGWISPGGPRYRAPTVLISNISPFPATHTYIKLTLVSFFSLFFFAPFPKNIVGTNFFDPKLTRPKLFKTERTWRLRIFQVFASLFELQFPVVYKMSKSIFDPHIAKENLRFQNLQSKKRSYLTHISQKKYLSHPMCRNTIV